MALTTLLSARAGLESARGTSLTPTRILYFGEGTYSQKVGSVSPRERRNSYFRYFRHYPGIERDGFDFAGDVTYDDLIWWANVHIKAVASGTGAGADKSWAFVPSTAIDDQKSATIQYAATDALSPATGWQLAYCLGDKLTLTWPDKSSNEPVTFKSSLLSAKASTQIAAFTGALSDRVTTTALATKTQIFIDSTTIGSTADSNCVSAEWELTSGFVYFDPLDNTAVAKDLYRPDSRDWTLKVTRYFASKGELDAYIADTERKIRIVTTGPSLGGSAYSITLDAYGVWDGYDWTDVNGLIMADMTLIPLYDVTPTTDFALTIVNATGAIT
jgi:hypothetical protein